MVDPHVGNKKPSSHLVQRVWVVWGFFHLCSTGHECIALRRRSPDEKRKSWEVILRMPCVSMSVGTSDRDGGTTVGKRSRNKPIYCSHTPRSSSFHTAWPKHAVISVPPQVIPSGRQGGGTVGNMGPGNTWRCCKCSNIKPTLANC